MFNGTVASEVAGLVVNRLLCTGVGFRTNTGRIRTVRDPLRKCGSSLIGSTFVVHWTTWSKRSCLAFWPSTKKAHYYNNANDIIPRK